VALDSASSVAVAANDRNSATFAKIASASKSGSFAIRIAPKGSFLETMSFNSFYFYTTPGGISKGHRNSSNGEIP
jgi:hypothetical protein